MTNMGHLTFKNKLVVVTGGRSGIGQAIVERLTAEGARVCIFSRTKILSASIQELIKQNKAFFYQLDVTDKQGLENAFAWVNTEFGPLDVLINNAGISVPGTLETLGEDQWDRVMNINLKGAFLCSQMAFQSLKEKGGSIVNIASMSGLEPYEGMGAYSCSKAGLVMLTRQMAIEWTAHNIRVNAVCPGIIKTPLNQDVLADPEIHAARCAVIPMNRIGKASEIANVVAFIASEEAAYITGQAITVDGGLLGSIQSHIKGRPGKA